MMYGFSNKNWLTVFITLLVTGIFFVDTVYAGTLSCTVRTSSCNGGEVEIFEMQNTTNSHAGLPAASYTNLVCCGGVTGLGNSCSGTFATALKLSGATNAHARQGTGADYAGANNACISVPTGGSVSVGYQATDCSGFDTTLGSMIGTTNSHVGIGSWTAGTTKICASAFGAGTLTTDIVDAGGSSVTNPSIAMGAVATAFSYQTVNGTLGVSTQKIRTDNSTGNAQWTLTIAADSGPTALWSAGTPKYDFNDPTANAGDGGDADSYGGQMTVNPSAGTLTPKSGCANTGLTLGSSASFSEGVTNSITLLTAGSSAAIRTCYWDLTGVSVSQTIPAEQAAGNYSLNMTLTVTAN